VARHGREFTGRAVSVADMLCYRKLRMSDLRLDKWLWAARFFKSRTLAASACDGGKVDVNEQAAKPSKAVRAGDLLHVTLPRGKRIVRIVTLTERRGGGQEAAALYEDLTPPPPPPELRTRPPAYRPPGAGRPTKRERRHLDRLSRG
jgi:ribosome-associated heat shock protein Hsp15